MGAAANALLLRGVIQLPASCIRSTVVSIEELVTLFADRALRKNDMSQNETDFSKPFTAEEKEAILLRKKQSQHQIEELMEILPSLQYGMDINPKFMLGPEGYEYTKNLIAFDLMGVDLVHGWLLDPKDKTAEIIGKKTYNELIEIVVKGKDVEDEINKVQGTIQKNKESLDNFERGKSTEESEKIEQKNEKNKETLENNTENEEDEESDWVQVDEENEKLENSNVESKTADGDKKSVESNEDLEKNNEDSKAVDNDGKINHEEDALDTLRKEIVDLEQKCLELQDLATKGQVVNLFLSETGHQLTRYGLEKLHEHVQELGVCVFFRNNHFSTMTMFEGQLFLLVTDLGYANVDEVVWEKLDAIDGNTDYFNAFFFKPEPREDDFILDPGSSLSPEHMMAQRDQSEIDYQLALSISERDNTGQETEEVLDLQTAKQLSLQEWNQNASSSQQVESNAGDAVSQNISEERDRQYALSLQSSYEGMAASERLAHQLQEEEKRMRQARMANLRRKNQSKSESSCIIS